jgi:hypothetical protein
MTHPRTDLVLESLNELRGMEEARLRKEAAEWEAGQRAERERAEAVKAEAERAQRERVRALEAERATEEARREREAQEAREGQLRRELALREEFEARRVAQEMKLLEARAEYQAAADRRGRGGWVWGLSAGALGLVALFGAGLWFGVLEPERARHDAELVSLREARRVAEDARGRAEADLRRAEADALDARNRAVPTPTPTQPTPAGQGQRVRVNHPTGTPATAATHTAATTHANPTEFNLEGLDGPDPMATDDLAPRTRPPQRRR